MDKEYIFYTQAISLHTKTDEDLQKEYQIHQIKYKQCTYEEFLKFKKGWHEDKYTIDSFINSYHLDLDEAKKYVINNVSDINESGYYNYAAICKAPIGVTYYNCEQTKEDFILYKYNSETKLYEELSKEEPEYNYLLEHIWQMISL